MTEAVDEAAIREALARILASEGFRISPRLSAFLRFVIERTLAGEAASLKGYTIATGALGRSEDFDPQADPIVRVEAGRLRKALDAYYAGPGRDDPIVVTVPRGRYVPSFQRAGAAAPPTAPCEPSVAPARPPSRTMLAATAAAIGFMLGVLSTSLLAPRDGAFAVQAETRDQLAAPAAPITTGAVATE